MKTAMRVWRKREVDGRNDGAKNTPSSAPPRTRKRTRRRGGEDERWPRAGVQHLQPGRAATPVWKKGRWRYRPLRSAPGPKGRGGGARGKTKKRPGRSPQLRSSSVPPAPLRSPPDPCNGKGRSREEDKRKARAELPPAPHTMGTADSAPHRTRPIGPGRRSRKGDLTKAKADLPAVPCSVGSTSSTEWALATRSALSRICKPPA